MIYAVRGYEPLAAVVMVDFVKTQNPAFDAEWANLYYELCPIAGIRTVMAFAQAIHETGYFRYTGDAQPEWNNPCGLGVGSAPLIRNGVEVPNSSNCKFPTREAGVRAHLGHMSVYVTPYEARGFCEHDPRHVPHRGLQNDIRHFGGPGRWAPSVTYGERVARIADALLWAR